MVEGTGLENRRGRKVTVGSNPTLSAIAEGHVTGSCTSGTCSVFSSLDCPVALKRGATRRLLVPALARFSQGHHCLPAVLIVHVVVQVKPL